MAASILARVRSRAQALHRVPRVAAVVVDPSPATESYLTIKTRRAADAGCTLDVIRSDAASTEELVALVASLDADAIIVQLPLPHGIHAQAVCDAIPVDKDADVLSSASRRSDILLPPVVGAVKEICETGQVSIPGKRAMVIGAGHLVGTPVAAWLTGQGADVRVLTKETEAFREALLDAEIVVSGAGSPRLITPDMLREGVVCIDAGTSESGGAIVGDADPACAEKCSIFTPVPGGLGPIAVAKLFENAVTLAERATSR